MSSKLKFKQLLVILFSVSLLLLLSHLVLSLVYPGTPVSNLISLSNEEIDKKFKETLHSFALKDEWISNSKK